MLLNSGTMYIFVIILLLCHSTTGDTQNQLPCGKNCTCTYSLNEENKIKADCSLKGLTAVPLDLPSNITDLNLSWNKINLQSNTNPSICKAYVNLSLLSFAWNNIGRISPVFAGCNKLIELDLTGNVLHNVNSRTFQGLGSLKQMKGLEVLDIDADTFKSLTSLDSLNLTYHGNIPNLLMFKDLSLLRELELFFEKLGRPNEKFFHFEQNNTLKILKLNSPLLKLFPPKLLMELKSLEYFSLNAPSIYNFTLAKEGKPFQLKILEIFNVRKITPDLLIGLTNLEVLRLYRIRNAEILILPPSVKELEVVECNLEMLPQNWLFNLTTLEKLSLRDNPIYYIDPQDFYYMKSMKHLDLSQTRISELPSDFLEPLKLSLQQFLMVQSDLKKLSKNAISNMMALEVIDLSSNYIEIIEKGNFKNMPCLTTLNLQFNNLLTNSASEDWYSTAPELREINLSFNSLNEFPETLLGANLSMLGLKGNNITIVPVRSICHMKSLFKLDLEDNPIHCNTSTEMFACLPGLQVIGSCETPWVVHSCRISELARCLSGSVSSSYAPSFLVTESSTVEPASSSTKKWLMSIVQEDTDATAIVRPINTLAFILSEATDGSKLPGQVTEEAPSQVKSSHVDGVNSLDTITKKVGEEVRDPSVEPAKNVQSHVLDRQIYKEDNNHTTERLQLVTTNITIQSETVKLSTQLVNTQDKNDSFSPEVPISQLTTKHIDTTSSDKMNSLNKTEIESLKLVDQSNSIEQSLSNVSLGIEYASSGIVSDIVPNDSFISNKSSIGPHVENNEASTLTSLSDTTRIDSTQSVIIGNEQLWRNDEYDVDLDNSSIYGAYNSEPFLEIDSHNLTNENSIGHLNKVNVSQLSDANRKSTPISEVLSVSLNPSVKDELILRNDTEARSRINQLIQPTQSSYQPENNTKYTITESDSKPTPDYRDSTPGVSPDILNPERILDNFNGLQTPFPESIDSLPGTQTKKQVLKPVYIKSANPKNDDTFVSFSSLVATIVVVVVLLSILGGGLWWFKKYWQTGTYNAATSGYQGHVDDVNISLSSMNKLA